MGGGGGVFLTILDILIIMIFIITIRYNSMVLVIITMTWGGDECLLQLDYLSTFYFILIIY